MAKVVLRKDETQEALIRRFKKRVEKEGIIEDIRKHEYFKSPAIKAREKHEAALKRAAKAARKFKKFNRD